jgi:hypothetical protein
VHEFDAAPDVRLSDAAFPPLLVLVAVAALFALFVTVPVMLTKLLLWLCVFACEIV